MANETIKPYETKMKKSYNNLLDEYTSIRAGRANPHVLDQLRVDYYGAPTAIQQVANVSVPEARMIMIQPWESIYGESNRESNYDIRHWHQPD